MAAFIRRPAPRCRVRASRPDHVRRLEGLPLPLALLNMLLTGAGHSLQEQWSLKMNQFTAALHGIYTQMRSIGMIFMRSFRKRDAAVSYPEVSR